MSSATSALAAGSIPARAELRKAAVEPLLPIETKLIGRSLGIRIGRLVSRAVVNRLFPVSV